MTNETEQKISVHGVYFENPLGGNAPAASVTTIVISGRRFKFIQAGMCSAAINSGGSAKDFKKLLELGNFVANILMPGHVDNVLKETLTPIQYQRALKANHEGKILKFSKARR